VQEGYGKKMVPLYILLIHLFSFLSLLPPLLSLAFLIKSIAALWNLWKPGSFVHSLFCRLSKEKEMKPTNSLGAAQQSNYKLLPIAYVNSTCAHHPK